MVCWRKLFGFLIFFIPLVALFVMLQANKCFGHCVVSKSFVLFLMLLMVGGVLLCLPKSEKEEEESDELVHTFGVALLSVGFLQARTKKEARAVEVSKQNVRSGFVFIHQSEIQRCPKI